MLSNVTLTVNGLRCTRSNGILSMVWIKFYGPFFLYLNQGENGKEIYQDALNKAREEKAKWPCSCVGLHQSPTVIV